MGLRITLHDIKVLKKARIYQKKAEVIHTFDNLRPNLSKFIKVIETYIDDFIKPAEIVNFKP